MTDSRVEEYRQQLQQRLLDASAAYVAVEQAAKTLNYFLVGRHRVDFPYAHDLADAVLADWLCDTLRAYSTAHQGATSAEIRISDLAAKYREIDNVDGSGALERALRCDEITLAEFIPTFMQAYDMAGLVVRLDQLSATLEQAGLTDAARTIVETMRMGPFYQSSLNPQARGRWMLFSVHTSYWVGGYEHTTWDALINLAAALDVASADIGVAGLGEPVRAIVDAYRNASGRMASRTVLAEGCALEGVVFKEKLQIRMSHELADSLIAFIRLHYDRPLWCDDKASAA